MFTVLDILLIVIPIELFTELSYIYADMDEFVEHKNFSFDPITT